ncbi:DUF3313 domain-containing protein [Shewanella sp. Scap07]|uniref:DUF3313 domain-containing protein n=1 Tax=Shewanella sp. Scap07 TaxID=2589987 RepID=UPI0015BB8F2E|nr:DUF3313 domain-containing protein [Shewanella sp. Scap07]QLE85062.1 DUF3313 domain-containing protein [Shewanella sp. Scap07]
MEKLLRVLFVGCIVTVTGCATQAPSIQQGPDAEISPEGLVRVDHSKLGLSFVKPNVDWSQYNKLYFEKVPVTNDHPADYRPPRIDRRTDGLNATYDLPPEILDKMSAQFAITVKDVFNSDQPYELVDTKGPGVLVVEAAVTDIRLSAPIESSRRSFSSMGTTYSESSGSMMLLAMIKDGESGELLAKAADRGQGFNQWSQNNQVFNWGDVKTVYRGWMNDFKNALMNAAAK